MIPTAANLWAFNKLGQLVARAGLDMEDTLKMSNFVEYGFDEELHVVYLKEEATVHSVKKIQAQGSATKTTATASGSKARRLPSDDEAIALLAETGAPWREVVATQVATAIGTVPDAFEIDAMGYGSNPYNSDPAKFMKKQGRTSASDLMLRKDHQGLRVTTAMTMIAYFPQGGVMVKGYTARFPCLRFSFVGWANNWALGP